YTVEVPGEYRWVESYSGDKNYEPHDGRCGAVNESSFVSGPAVGPPPTPLPTVPAPAPEAPAPTRQPRTVAFTGAASGPLALAAGALMLLGGLLLAVRRRRSE
ncbi:MAG: LPXTG cell wall anchor domain-containing protein, partial [Actinobacteria bacterium]|nr:LPXTG cell wall anchor domain-containing protein [Actinomycetota bacterium]